eukprot:scaffold55560_cov30-Tisochrysis_lutea.AAC.2
MSLGDKRSFGPRPPRSYHKWLNVGREGPPAMFYFRVSCPTYRDRQQQQMTNDHIICVRLRMCKMR